jgi:HK97 family phage portal protein
MGLLDFFRRSEPVAAPARSEIGSAVMTLSLNDPLLLDFLRGGGEAITGQTVGVERALRNPSMLRAVSLIANSIGMLPMHLIDQKTKEKATDEPLYRLLHRQPNNWQSAFDFRALMQLRALVRGDAFALVVRRVDVRRGKQQSVERLIPLEPEQVTVRQRDDWSVEYRVQPRGGATRTYQPHEILHLRGISLDGLHGLSLVKQARDAIAIALAAEMAAGRLFKNGVLAGQALKHPGKLSPEAFDRLKASLEEKEGAENAGKSLILEEGMDWSTGSKSARDSQLTELRKLQVEEIARVTGVPRPLLMVDETSWGSGIEALGQFFVAYALNPWFEAWQQAIERTLLTEEERGRLAVKFNAAALLRGSLKDQADFLSKALGAGGHAPWMHVDEVRDVMDLPEREAPPHTMMAGSSSASGDDPKPKRSGKPSKQDDDDDEE